MSLSTAATIAARSASATESNGRRRAARARTRPAPSSSAVAARTSRPRGSVTAKLGEDAVERLAGIEAELLGGAEPDQADEERRRARRRRPGPARWRHDPGAAVPPPPGWYVARVSADGSGGIGAGGGIRTRDIRLGRLALCQLSYSRSLRHRTGWAANRTRETLSDRPCGPDGHYMTSTATRGARTTELASSRTARLLTTRRDRDQSIGDAGQALPDGAPVDVQSCARDAIPTLEDTTSTTNRQKGRGGNVFGRMTPAADVEHASPVTRRGIRLALALALLAIAIGPAAAVRAGQSPAKLPDLAMVPPFDFRIENNAGRRLLRFSTVSVNVGAGPFRMYGSDEDGTRDRRHPVGRPVDQARGRHVDPARHDGADVLVGRRPRPLARHRLPAVQAQEP